MTDAAKPHVVDATAATFEDAVIRKSLETPVLVTDADQYADVVEMAGQTVKAGEPLLTVLK